MNIQTALIDAWKQRDLLVAQAWKERDSIAASSWLAVISCAIVALGALFCFYLFDSRSANGEPFAWFDGISAWPSIAIFIFAAFLSIHFILKTHFSLRQSAARLTVEFGFKDLIQEGAPLFAWSVSPLETSSIRVRAPLRGEKNKIEKINIVVLWERYLRLGRFWMRVSRAVPMTILYIFTLAAILPLFGHFPIPPTRGQFPFLLLIIPTICLFLFLTFVVLDAIRLHEGFLAQLVDRETYWPNDTFRKFGYPIGSRRTRSEKDLADYWDILLIAKRTASVGNIVYYPFIILSLLVVARMSYFDNWTWSAPLVIALCLHFCLAFYAAWRLPKMAKDYRDKVLERMKRRRRQAFIRQRKIPEAIDTMIEEVQSTHQGAFSYVWEQPAIRALLFPSGGIGLATLLQYLPQ
jgi:hypothetical protein